MRLLFQHKALRNASVSCLFGTNNQLYVHICIYVLYHTQTKIKNLLDSPRWKRFECPNEVGWTGLIPLIHSKRLRQKKFLALSNRGISKKLIKSWPLVLASLGRGELVDGVHQVGPLVPRGELRQQVRHPLRLLRVVVAHHLPLVVVRQLLLAVFTTVTAHTTARVKFILWIYM